MNKTKMLKTAAKLATPHLAASMLGRKKSLFGRSRSPLDRAVDFGRGLMPAQRSTSSAGSTALKGIGAAAVAIPLGMWLGRKLTQRDEG